MFPSSSLAPSTAFLHRLFVVKTAEISLDETKKSHAILLKSLIIPSHTNLTTKILSLYAHHRKFATAAAIFRSLPFPDRFAFSALFSAFVRDHLFAPALALIPPFLSLALPLDQFILPIALKASGALPSLIAGRQLHALSLVSGLTHDPFVQSSLVHMYLKCGSGGDAHRVFDRMYDRNVVSWSAMVGSYANAGDVEGALGMMERMQSSGVEPNLITWNGMIAGFCHSGCFREAMMAASGMNAEGFRFDGVSFSSLLPAVGNLEDLRFGLQIHGYVIKVGLEGDKCVVSALIDMYGKCQCAQEMVKVFDEIGQMDVGSCNALITALSRNGLVDSALETFRNFEAQGIELNVVSWTSIVACCTQNGKDMEALELFREMQAAGVEPNAVTVPCLLPACGNMASLIIGKSAHCFALRKDFLLDVYVGSGLVDMYAKCGRTRLARTIFDAMPLRNVVSWNAMIGGYAMNGKVSYAIELFHSMKKSKQKPDHVTFTCLLSACSQGGLTDEGEKIFNEMQRNHGVVAKMEHYACMVSLLGRAGKLGDAYDLITKMQIKPDSCVWGALLSSCRIYNNVGLAEIAAEELFNLEPWNAGNYVLLSNIYAAKGMLDGVNKMRDLMKYMGVKKDPGCSWIEIKDKVHMLLAGDKSHPQIKQIMDKLKILNVEMKRLGHVPSTDFVLQDVEEQEKEHILFEHSEKLAIALGLISTGSGTPLRVIKNLRICGDCHAAIKFIASFEGREISVRDTNRFHHFKNGMCSCGDFW